MSTHQPPMDVTGTLIDPDVDVTFEAVKVERGQG